MSMNRTNIEYLDFTLSPIVGCSGIGCAVTQKCWAKAMAKRQKHRCSACYNFEPHFHRERLLRPLKRKKPARIGLNFMGETFDKVFKNYCPYIYDEIFDMIEKAHWHTFVILTKQPQNIPFRYFPENLWLGVSVNHKQDLWRKDKLLRHQASVHILSCEPLYGDLGKIDLDHIEWIIIGAQTRPEVLPELKWVMSLDEQARQKKIPVFMKNNLRMTYQRQDIPTDPTWLGGTFMLTAERPR